MNVDTSILAVVGPTAMGYVGIFLLSMCVLVLLRRVAIKVKGPRGTLRCGP